MARRRFEDIPTAEQLYAAQRQAPALREQAYEAAKKADAYGRAADACYDSDPDHSAREQRAADREGARARRLSAEARSMVQAVAPQPKKRSWF